MRKEIENIKDMVRNNPELEIVAREGLLLTISKMKEFENNSKKWTTKKK